MRIALITRSCPIAGADGIARQRQALARTLASRGHDVRLFTIGDRPGRASLGDAVVHTTVRSRHPNPWFPETPVLDWPMTDSQILWELVEREHAVAPFDIVDIPLWLAQGAVTLERSPMPVALWLQTTTQHLIALQEREPRAHELVLLALETRALERSAIVIGDSQVVFDDVQRMYGVKLPAHRASMVWPGLDGVERPWSAERADREWVDALVVGRLEQRKGTRELFDRLPDLLQRAPRLRVTFVGADNSDGDGFRKAHGVSYPEHFAARHPELAARVRFTGRVSDEDLDGRYRHYHLLLHPAHYESFGLVYLEAMRAGLPTATFDVAGAREIHDATTARLAPAGDWERLVSDVVELAGDRDARQAMGVAARARFERCFTADAMADRTLEAYARAANPTTPRATPLRAERDRDAFRLFQLTEALQSPDGVGHIIRTQARMLTAFGGVAPVQTIYVQADLAPETGRVSATRFTAHDVAMLHFYGYSRLERLFAALPSRRIVHYHNITPPSYFSPLSGGFEMTTRGLAQLPRMAALADMVTGDSEFNVRELAAHLPVERPALPLYPLVDRARLLAKPVDEAFLDTLRAQKAQREEAVLMFVGRIAPNKRQDLVIEAAGRLAAEGDRPVRLILAGGGGADAAFDAAVAAAARRYPSLTVDLTGSIADDRLYACYRVADAFISASEHEGFGIPIAEAMAFGVPVVAAAHAAVPETMGDGGILLPTWSATAAADAVSRLLTDPEARAAVLRAQDRNIERFSEAALTARLHDLAAFLRDGRPSPFIASSDVLLSRRAS